MNSKDAQEILGALAVWVADELNQISSDLQETLILNVDLDIQDKRSEVLHKSLLLSKLHRDFKLSLADSDYALLFDLIANQVTFK